MIGTLSKDSNIESYIDLIHTFNNDPVPSKLIKKLSDTKDSKVRISEVKEAFENLLSIIYLQSKTIKELELKNRKLEDKLSLNSQNSSKPPSSDVFTKRKPRTKSEREKGNKKSGGQTGRKGKTLNQVEKPDFIIPHQVENCKRCGKKLPDESIKIVKRQIFDISDPKIKVFEHQVHTKKCPCCKSINKESFPPEVKARVQYSKRIKRIITYLFVYQFIPYERLTDYFIDIYGHKISEGTVNNALKETFKELEPWEDEVKQDILRSLIVHFDESGMRESGIRKWLHVASTEKYTYYQIHDSRGRKALDDIGILPNFKGNAVHDSYPSYFMYRNCKHILCNAHHIRELRKIFETGGIESRFANQMRILLKRMNYVVSKAKENGKDRLEEKQIKKFRKAYSLIMRRWNACYKKHCSKDEDPQSESQLALFNEDAHPPPYVEGERKQSKAKNLFDRLKKYKENILMFLKDFRIPFDNNLAERDIRMAKLKQKISGTFRNSLGGKIFCRIRSFISTMRKQGYRFFEAMEMII